MSIFLTGLVVGIAVAILAILVILPRQTFLVYESKFGFEETVEAIQESAKENKWSMPHSYDLQATMKKHGYNVQAIKVFSLCKPELAAQILSENEQRLASALMPCRIAVYENEGKTYISMLNSGLFSKLMGGKIKSVMGAAASENAKILEPVITF